ncbi:glutamate receptor 2.7-like protein [Cinnamomum micranthum f. kanehirae]|uniref:Glutamate receptor n=1 Tax=Cinnamomum micranthum f. kanehirae TaxID=337451 RepID=A0A3S3NUA7_9MAGN|nr:glutamate receptor 2.7-like protein [Cinnamomum micranthum f. kanehirae]
MKVKAIIGPETSAQAQFMAELGNKAHVPILSFSATSPCLSTITTPYFIRTGQSDLSQVKAIIAIIQAFGWKEVVPIYEDTPYGNGLIPNLTIALQEVNIRVPYKSLISHQVTDDQIEQELYKLETMQTRVFVVHLSPSLSSRLFFKANKVRMMSEGYVWIITDGLANVLYSMNSPVIQSMQGVLGVRPYIPKSKELDDFKERWKRKFLNENPNLISIELNVFGLWAYDTVWALAEAAEEVGTKNSYFLNPQTRQNSTDLARLGVYEMGPRLRDTILKTNFKGLSGKFSLSDGQLDTSSFQILNMVGKGEREIGFWTPVHGLDKKLNTGKKDYSASKAALKPIIWPGETTTVPKGWEISTSERKLRIGVPLKMRFREFVNVVQDLQTNETTVTGYCIDVFKGAIERLPYAINYEFIPFVDKYGRQAGTYNDLIDQVYFKNIDAVVGDLTIIANRSQYVDFTLPYTESGVTMLVLANNNRKTTWIFLKPLSWDLWLMTGAAFVFTGTVVWAIEHRINNDFRGPIADQFGIMLWFSFSTLVFAHRERVVSNWSRFVVIIWLFVVLILTSSYTASLTSMLTIQQLQPAINDIDDLIKNRENVGYQNANFVGDILRRLKVEESKLKTYETVEEYAEALSKGTKKGGAGAIFDEIPYLRIFLAKNGNCAKYKMAGPIYQTGGFGFAFPKGSPLVPDLSWAILNLTEGDDMSEIEKKWMGPETTCPDQPTTAESNSLTLDSFWGLFLVTGTTSVLAFLINLFTFLYKYRHVLITCDSSISFQQRLITIVRHFNERDLSHHTFRRSKSNEGLEMGNRHAGNSPVAASAEPSSPRPNREASVMKTETEDDAR